MACEMWSSQMSGAQRKKIAPGRCRRAELHSLADPPHSPRPVLRPVPGLVVDRELTVGMTHRARPRAELVEAGGIHHAPHTGPQDLPFFLQCRGAGRERQIACQAGFVVVEDYAGSAQRFDDLESEGTHARLGAFLGRSSRRVEAVLEPTGLDRAERAVEDPAMWIDGQPDAEVLGGLLVVPVEPGAVVEVRVRGRRVRHGLGRLVDREVVEFVQHNRRP